MSDAPSRDAAKRAADHCGANRNSGECSSGQAAGHGRRSYGPRVAEPSPEPVSF